MKIRFSIILFLVITSFLHSLGFESIKENMSIEDVIKLVGNPTRKLTSKDNKNEYYLWFKKDDLWCVFFQNNKTTGKAGKIEVILQNLLEMTSTFSSFKANNTETKDDKLITSEKDKDASKDKIIDTIKSQIEITVIDSKIIETWDGEKKAGTKFKIKNDSIQTIYNLDLTVFYYNKKGQIFYEETFYPVNSSSWTDKVILKPNYSLLYPSEKDKYLIASKMDISEWDEGKIKVEISKIDIQNPENK